MRRLRILREENEETQVELAAYLSVDQSMISNWERGVHSPSKPLLFKIADHYGVSVDYLLEYTENRDFAELETTQLLYEYLLTRLGREYDRKTLMKLDDIFANIANLM